MITNRTATPLAAAVALAALGVGPVPGAVAEGADDPVLDATDAKKVDEFLERAKETEQAVSPELKSVALISRATLVGFDDRLSSADSVRRKVAALMKRTPGQTVEAALAKIEDSVHYTLQWPDGRYTDGVKAASAALVGWDNDSVRWSNTWGRKNSRKAIDSAWRDRRSGHTFAVRFHTPSSRWAQEAARKLQGERRRPGTQPDRVKELRRQQEAIFTSVPVPEGAERLAAPASPPPAATPAPAAPPAPEPAPVPAPVPVPAPTPSEPAAGPAPGSA
ncbi:ATP nucleotide 3'-pyrophosphokinase [Streptomyces sp. HU2014]|uniref:ATP nucleotide 3'-pyrophosphokinase n=1 Tax=Streptomyces sp. HU2014 TaxID=2939414 RepID=UPI00200FC518|nr:ATP nucleotide 3'-pyrophosphokinase [Streptomyces sp. HU2014]UQI45043.1 ATP nucleotide 3'-pyrophosphokinase [Streptomyces sp. HU2014]